MAQQFQYNDHIVAKKFYTVFNDQCKILILIMNVIFITLLYNTHKVPNKLF